VRNTKVVDLAEALRQYNINVDIYDPWIDVAEAEREYGLRCLAALPDKPVHDAVILAVGHQQFVALGAEGIKALVKPGAVLFDVKGVLPRDLTDGRL
jgi:UDP-N-acetyl-D-galactosamine dehydrogenase